MKKIAALTMFLTLVPALGVVPTQGPTPLESGVNSVLFEIPRPEALKNKVHPKSELSLKVILSDTRWEDSQFPLRKKVAELQRELQSIRKKRVFLGRGSISSLNPKASIGASEVGTMNLTSLDAQLSKIEETIRSITQFAQTEITWTVDRDENNNDPFEIHLPQLIQHFKLENLEPIVLEVRLISDHPASQRLVWVGSLNEIYKSSQSQNWTPIDLKDSSGLTIQFYRRPDFMNLIAPDSNNECVPCFFRK